MATIQGNVDKIKADLKKIQKEMDAKVSKLAADARKTENKPYGVVNIETEGVKVKHTLNKAVTWDQEVLASIVGKINASGDDPAEYVTTSYKIEEKKFTSWPKAIKKIFLPARISKPGKPSYKIIIPDPPAINMPGK